jgi:hypothetical protein
MTGAFSEVCDLLRRLESDDLPEYTWLESLPWEKVLEVAMGHGVLAPIAGALRSANLVGAAHGHEALLQEYPRRVRAKNKFLSQELRRVQQKLQKEQVPSLTFKGPALALQAFGGLHLRTCGDIDLLVPPDAFSTVQRALEDQGYRINTYIHGAVRQRIRRFFNRQFTFTRGASVFHLDVHTAITSPRYAYAPAFDELMGRAQTVDAEGIHLESLSTEDMLLAACYQGLKDRWRKLKHVLDIDRIVRTGQFSWPLVLSCAREARSVRVLFLGVALAHRLLDTPLSPSLRSMVFKDPATKASCAWAEKALRSWPAEPSESYLERVRLYSSVQDDIRGVARYAAFSALRKVWHLYEKFYLATR